jgi:hypothetical protein
MADLQHILNLIAGGELDRLTPADIARLERCDDSELSAIADRSARVSHDPLVAAVAQPGAAEWARMWSVIDARSQATRRDSRKSGIIQIYRAAMAVAACAALAVCLIRGGGSADEAPLAWDLQLSGDVDVLELEAFGSTVSAVDLVNDESGAAIISLFDDSDDADGV